MRIASASLVLLLAGSALAQTQIPLPPYTSTFASTTATRGLYFQAPLPFVIVGLRVPDERAAGVQCVEVLNLPGPPPLYSQTATGTQLFYANNQPSSQIIPCSIPIQQNDWVGVLGACGTSTMNNSYGAGNFASDVLGQPITLARLLTQTNLHNTGGNQPYSTEAGASIARVEIYVVPATGYASWLPYGNGCGNPAVRLGASARPVVGQSFNLVTSNIPAGSQLGATVLSYSQLLPPIPLASLGMPGCEQHAGLDATLIFLPTGTTGSVGLSIPNRQSFAGQTIFSQSATFSPGVNPLGVLSSNGVSLLLDLQ